MQVRLRGTPTVLVTGGLWVAIAALGMTGYWYPGLHLSVVLMVLLVALGSAHRGRIGVGLLLYPILAWGALWAVSFVFAERSRAALAGGVPETTFLGFHPSFAWIVFGYWLGGVAVLTLGFHLRRDDWMPEEHWRELESRLERLAAERRGARERQ